MAAAAASKALCESSAKSLVLLLFLALLLLVTLSDLRPTDLSNTPKADHHSSSARRLLLHHPSTQQSAMEVHPKQSNNSGNRQYEAAAHEVPSGPNPISNK
jgi:hypothetical protein